MADVLYKKKLLRLAKSLLNHHRPMAAVAVPELPDYAWERLKTLQQSTSLVAHRGWVASRISLSREFKLAITSLSQMLGNASAQLNELTKSYEVTLKSILDDLIAISEEFEDFAWDLQAKTVSIVTEEIELKDDNGHMWELGRFKLTLRYALVEDDTDKVTARLKATALTPNACEKDSSVTHPHVSHNNLCFGEGQAPAQAAFRQVRLFDFFEVVTQVLRTYNSGSAYEPLEGWDESSDSEDDEDRDSCTDCGDGIYGDDGTTCITCGDSLCGECGITCSDENCGDTSCAACKKRCAECKEYFCSAHVSGCTGCGVNHCDGCLDEDGRCHTCVAGDNPEPKESIDDSADEPDAGGRDDSGDAASDAASDDSSDDLVTAAIFGADENTLAQLEPIGPDDPA